VAIPTSETQLEADLFDVLTILFLAPLGSGRARHALQLAIGDDNLEFLFAFLAFIRTAHFWTETHPDIDCEPDVIKLMEHNEELARLLLDPTDAEQTRGEVERAQALTSLRESQGRFDAVADLVPDLLWSGDASGRTTWFNRRWINYTGRSLEHFQVEGWLEAIHPDDREASNRTFQNAIDAGLSFQQEHRIRCHDSAFRWFLMRGEPVRDVAGRIIEWFGSATDIDEQKRAQEALLVVNKTQRTAELQSALDALEAETAERYQAEDALRQSQKMEAVGQLTGGVAHDFNNLLTAVMGNLELLRKRFPDDQRAQRLIEGAMQGAERGSSLTQRMLAFARQQDLKTSSAEMASLLAGMGDLLERTLGPRIALCLQTPAGLPTAQVDTNQIELAILNLAINARDAMPDGGTLSISVDKEQVGAEKNLREGSYLRVRVSDTGSGMDAATLKKAVEPFFSTKPLGKGTGLGLSMVHGLAVQLGGLLELSSEVGKGTTATLWLPIATNSLAVKEPALLQVTPGRPSTILVVDDDPLIAMSTVCMLEDLGHTVIEANSAQRALEILEAGQAVDLMMTDQAMPGMTGVELAEIVRRKRPNMPVLLATGYADLPTAHKSKLPRLSKPYHQAQLQAEIDRLLETP
jgi:PAS domain S-box-containing protein